MINLVNNLLSCAEDHSMLPSVKGDWVIMKKDFVKQILTITPKNLGFQSLFL